MIVLGFILALNVVALTVYLLLKKHNAAVILILMGMLLSLTAILLDINSAKGAIDNFIPFYLLEKVTDIFSSTLAGIGLMVMLLCGYVEYMKRIGASNAFAYLMVRPMSILKGSPNAAVIILIPIGLLLNLAIPSASGVALLLVATVYPILVNTGMDRINALSAITACTLLDYGLNSHTSVVATKVLGVDGGSFFNMQLRYVIPMIVIITVVFFLYYVLWDRRFRKERHAPAAAAEFKWKRNAPLYYALLPMLPLVLSFVFSTSWRNTGNSIFLSLNSAILLSFFISVAIDMIQKRSFHKSVSSMSGFWSGMGDTFSSTVVMIFAASIFSQGLVDIGTIDFIANVASSANLGHGAIITLMSMATFVSTVLTGSGNAPAAAYAQTIPDLAVIFDIDPVSLMLPVQLISGIGRVITPISVVVIVLSEFGEIDAFRLAKRNLIPVSMVTISLITLFLINLL